MKREITLGMVVGCLGLIATLGGCVGTSSTDASGAQISGDGTGRADSAEDGGAASDAARDDHAADRDAGSAGEGGRCTTELPDGWYPPGICQVALIHCEEGQRYVSNECGCGCEPTTCTSYFTPFECHVGERAVCGIGEDGCEECHCEIVSCLPIAPPVCAGGESPVCSEDEHGCPQCRCPNECVAPQSALIWYAQDFCIRANIRCEAGASFVSNECGCGCVPDEAARS